MTDLSEALAELRFLPDDQLAARIAELTGPTLRGPSRLRLPELARMLDSTTVQTPALDLVDTALEQVLATPDDRAIICVPPQEGKTTRCSKVFPVAVMADDPTSRNGVASYGMNLARGVGRFVRDAFRNHEFYDRDGNRISVRSDVAVQTEWETTQGGGFISVGIGSGFAGKPISKLLVIDDPIKDQKEADSFAHRQGVWEWFTTVAAARLGPGARIVLVTTRWHDDDLAGRLMRGDLGPHAPKWRVLNIPAQANHKPHEGQTDVLGRKPGEFMQSALGRTTAQWELRKAEFGSRAWEALAQGNPTAPEGTVFKREWFSNPDRMYRIPPWTVDADGAYRVPDTNPVVTQSWDMAFKGAITSDLVVGQVWLKRGPRIILLAQVRGHWTFTETIAQVQALVGKWPQTGAILVEDKANGTAVIDTLKSKIPGLIPVNPTMSKTGRAQSVTPYFEAGNVDFPHPSIAPWVGDWVEEMCAFGGGAANDDQVDATTQALRRLLGRDLEMTVSKPSGSQGQARTGRMAITSRRIER